ncbi:MAG: thermonuclease family protein [Nitrospinae bacterium]|nr:thermonuclease family protein [Nitrospinota bacterium]
MTLLSLWLAATSGPTLTGKVVAVHDGDTFTLQSGSSLYKVRLAEVDAPEMGQVFGQQARRFTEELALGRRVRVNISLIDKYDRRVGTVIIEDGRVLNEELVHAGLAWYYRVSPVRNPRLQRLEQGAFQNRLGLWVEKEPIPPWEFRRESTLPELPATASQVDYDRIFHYGMVGNRRTKKFRWPACKHYRLSRPRQALIFHSRQQARQMGFQPAKDCPR